MLTGLTRAWGGSPSMVRRRREKAIEVGDIQIVFLVEDPVVAVLARQLPAVGNRPREAVNMPAVRPGVHLPALQMMHVLGAAAALLDPGRHRRTVGPDIMGRGRSGDEDEGRVGGFLAQ